MRIGLMAGATAAIGDSLDSISAFAKMAEAKKFNTVWLANIFGLDAITTLSIIGRETSEIELGTAVTPSYPRHPSAMAQQALTASVACSGRFSLGVGLSHKLVIEDFLGMSYEKPARHMREYLEVLSPLLKGEAVSFDGQQYSTHLALDVPGAKHIPLLIAALGPTMLKLAGSIADGTTTWMVGTQTLESYIIPTMKAEALAANRPAPRIVAGLPIALTDDVVFAKEKIAKDLEIYGMMPSYRAMLDKENAAGPADIALVGDRNSLKDGIARLRDIGVTDFNAAIIPVAEGVFEDTVEFLQSELA
jgi:5,10-methylenetetrahydromethanopterin reductase